MPANDAPRRDTAEEVDGQAEVLEVRGRFWSPTAARMLRAYADRLRGEDEQPLPRATDKPLGNCPRCFGTGSCEHTEAETQVVNTYVAALMDGEAIIDPLRERIRLAIQIGNHRWQHAPSKQDQMECYIDAIVDIYILSALRAAPSQETE